MKRYYAWDLLQNNQGKRKSEWKRDETRLLPAGHCESSMGILILKHSSWIWQCTPVIPVSPQEAEAGGLRG
jgi:hypothetical protein